MKEAIFTFISGFLIFLGSFILWVLGIGSIVAIFVMLYRHFVYGYNYLDVFRPRKKFEASIPILLNGLKSIDIDMRIIVPKEYYADLLLVSDGGIFLIKVFPYQDGNVENYGKYLEANVNGSSYHVPNPYRCVEADYKKIHDMFKDAPIYAYVIFGDQNALHFTYSGIAKTVRYKNLNYQIKRDYNETARFISSTELKKINSKLR
jgi:hypothetical protein